MIFKLVCSIIAQVASGVPIWRISIPSLLHDDLSGVEALRKLMFHNEASLACFNEIDTLESPMERLINCLKAIVDPHVKFMTDKPYNPSNIKLMQLLESL